MHNQAWILVKYLSSDLVQYCVARIKIDNGCIQGDRLMHVPADRHLHVNVPGDRLRHGYVLGI